MVLPWPILAIKAAIWVQSTVFLRLSAKEHRGLSRQQVTECSIGPPSVLLAYRAAMLILALATGVPQAISVGPTVFAYFTVWNWWLLTAYFAAGTVASAKAVLRQRRWQRQEERGRAESPAELEREAGPARFMDKALVAAFHIEVPVSLMIDLMTWLLLVPMLMETDDSEKREYWRRIMFCATSYMQHGANFLMMLGELLLSRMPAKFWWSGWLGIWASLFGVWSTLFHHYTGRFLYPFLDAYRPYAWVGYIGMWAMNLAVFAAFMGAVKGREALIARRRRPAKLHAH